MAQFEAELSERQLALRLEGCGGDVKIVGHESNTIVIEGSKDVERYMQRFEDNVCELRGYPDDLLIRLPRQATVELHDIGGDVQVRSVSDVTAQAVARLDAQGIGGDVQIAQVPTIELGSIGGDVEIEGGSQQVNVGQVGGDFKLDHADSLSLKGVGGDARIGDVRQLSSFGNIGGDLKLTWSGTAEGALRGSVGGDVQLYLAVPSNMTLNAIVGGDVRAQTDGQNIRHSAGRHQFVFGTGEAQLQLTIGGDLHLKSAVAPEYSGARGSYEGGTAGEWGAEWRTLGRELEEMGRELAKELSGLGREIAREVRVAGREARRDIKDEFRGFGRGPRGKAPFGSQWNLDPDQVERIKREARAAAASGIAKAQEAVEQALQQWQQSSPAAGGPRPPRPPRPPQPPAGPYTGHTVRIDNEEAAEPSQQTAPRDRDAERLAILRMVHEGRLAPDEAEMLLRGLG
jgi:hypothetical protein